MNGDIEEERVRRLVGQPTEPVTPPPFEALARRRSGTPARRIAEAIALVIIVIAAAVGGRQLASFRQQQASSSSPVAAPAESAVRSVLVDVSPGGPLAPLRARPIDPITLADLPGFEPLSFAHHYRATVSPDGRTIVAILWPSGSNNSGGRIHLIDARTWADRIVGESVDSTTGELIFDSSGTHVYWTRLVNEGNFTTAAFALDVVTGGVTELVQLPPGFLVRENVVVANVVVAGDRLAIFAISYSSDGLSPKPPELFLVDIGSQRLVASVPIPAIRAGQYRVTTAGEYPFREIDPGLAWDIPRARLFIADGESDRLFVADLRTGSVRGPLVARQERTLLDAVWSVFGTAAEAKQVSSTRQDAAISADGKRLYVSGLRSDLLGSGNSYRETDTPLELRIIDTETVTEISRLDGAASPLWLSPEGRTLLYATNDFEAAPDGSVTRQDFKLHLVDTAQLRETALLTVSGEPRLQGFDPAGRIAYFQAQDGGASALENSTAFTVDLSSGRISAERRIDKWVADILLLH